MRLPDGPPIPRIGPDTRERWLIRDLPRTDLEDWLNAACALGWSLDEVATITEAEPPLGVEIVRVWCSAEIPQPRVRRNPPRRKVPDDS